MTEYLITVALADHGRPEVVDDNLEAVLSSFEKRFPSVGAAVGADLVVGHLEVTFSVEAEDADQALERGRPIFAEGTAGANLGPTTLEALHVEAAPASTPAEAELQLA